MILREYKKKDAKEIIKWTTNERDFRLWSADRYNYYPINENDINKNYDECMANGNFYPMTLEDNNEIVGHLILRNPTEDKSIIRLGFIIVDKDKRGKGYGRKLIEEAINYSITKLKAKEINLGVFTNNVNAYECYKKCGFKTVKIDKNVYNYHGELWDCAEMILQGK